MNPVFRCVVLLCAVVAVIVDPWATTVSATESVVTSVVGASIDQTYRRTKKPDGSYRPEYYALSFGGQANGTLSHQSIDRVPRAEFEGLIKEHLAKQNYLMAPDAASAGLLIHLLWGMTDPPFDDTNLDNARNTAADALSELKATGASNAPGFQGGWGIGALTPEQREAEAKAEGALISMVLENRIRDRALAPTASLLGYIDAMNDLVDNPALHAGLGTLNSDLWSEIGERRYYVVVYAYDFKELRERKTLKPLWVTRVSIPAKGNDFDKHLAAMVARAGGHFGRKTRGLSRTLQGHVEIGEAEVLGVEGDEPKEAEKPAEQHEEPVDTPPSDTPTPAAP